MLVSVSIYPDPFLHSYKGKIGERPSSRHSNLLLKAPGLSLSFKVRVINTNYYKNHSTDFKFFDDILFKIFAIYLWSVTSTFSSLTTL
jgi:hypothetical protein